MKLHLGCGQKYLEGYLNIDLPAEEEMKTFPRKVDLMQDLTTLRYPPNSIDEIRNHHVFEHFTRPMACALLVTWSHWLRDEGILHIEVPDYLRTSLSVFNPFSSLKEKGVGVRHVFGSHHAPWAVHAEGYTPKTLKFMLASFGFESTELKKHSWRGTYNVEITTKKINNISSLGEANKFAKFFLKNFLVDDSEGELKILDLWILQFLRQVSIGTDLK
jgi:hypothetical protein